MKINFDLLKVYKDQWNENDSFYVILTLVVSCPLRPRSDRFELRSEHQWTVRGQSEWRNVLVTSVGDKCCWQVLVTSVGNKCWWLTNIIVTMSSWLPFPTVFVKWFYFEKIVEKLPLFQRIFGPDLVTSRLVLTPCGYRCDNFGYRTGYTLLWKFCTCG